jgi:hypothetical protein
MRRLLCVLLFASVFATPAVAQQSGRFAIGLNVSERFPLDSSSVVGRKGAGLVWRFGHAKEGWHWSYGLGWYAAHANWNVDGQQTEIGELKVRPIMAGYGYSHLMGKYTLSADVVGGYVFTGFDAQPQFVEAFRSRTGVDVTDIDVSNTIAVRPGVSLWYDFNKKIGVNVGANFTSARPKLTVTSARGTDVRRLHADMFSVRVGMVYSIF